MNMASALRFFNQDGPDDDQFVERFVARREVLDTLLRRIRAIEPDGAASHQILIGPRGMGKTSLLRRVAIAINQEPDLAERFIPLRFREEQYNVLTLGDFWRNCGEALAEWAEVTGKHDLAHRLDRDMATRDWHGDEASFQRLIDEATTLDRRLVLLVDNLDLILDQLESKDASSLWRLRKHLQERGGPVMVAAAVHLLKDTADRQAAFYQFFDPLHLEPLDVPETERCMLALADRRGEAGRNVIETLRTQPERLRTLHTLTGGNPRVLALIYRLLESAESEAAMADLEILLDQVTPYYKARIEEYQSAQQRAVIDAIALHWDPATTGDLAAITNIPSTTLSPILSKLRNDGLIESTETSGSYAGHQLSERFMNIWYLMRHGTRRTKQRMRWLVAFLTSFYSSDQLRDIHERALACGAAARWHADFAFAFQEALTRGELPLQPLELFGEPNRSDLSDKHGSSRIDSHEVRVDAHYEEVAGLVEEVSKFLSDGEPSRALALTDALIAKIGEPSETSPLRLLLIAILLYKSVALKHLGMRSQEIAILNNMLSSYGKEENSEFREILPEIMLRKARACSDLNDYTAAIGVVDDMISIFATDIGPGMPIQMADALVLKAAAHYALGGYTAAIDTCNLLLELEQTETNEEVSLRILRALGIKGSLLLELGDPGTAIPLFSKIFARASLNKLSVSQWLAALSLAEKAHALNLSHNPVAAIAAFQQFLDFVGDRLFEEVKHDNFTNVKATAVIQLAALLIDREGGGSHAKSLLMREIGVEPLASKAILVWLYLFEGRIAEVLDLLPDLSELPVYGRTLLDAALALAQDNFGQSVGKLGDVLSGNPESEHLRVDDDLLRYLRLAEKRGHGERLLSWLQESGFADRVAPLYIAFKAYLRGEAVLLDVNPEVRGPARTIFDRLEWPRRAKAAGSVKPVAVKHKRGRSKKT